MLFRSTIEKLDEMVEEDRRYWNRTHLINEALVAYIKQWEEDQEEEVIVDASEVDGLVDEDEAEGQGDLFDPNVPFPVWSDDPPDDDDDEDDE